MRCRQLQERAQRNALAAEHAQHLEREIQQREAAHAHQHQQDAQVFSLFMLPRACALQHIILCCMDGAIVMLQDAEEMRRQWTADRMAQQLELQELQQMKAERMADAMAQERWDGSTSATSHFWQPNECAATACEGSSVWLICAGSGGQNSPHRHVTSAKQTSGSWLKPCKGSRVRLP
jgi:hypothetical protein